MICSSLEQRAALADICSSVCESVSDIES
jgi:hypothetical protein